jgi:hypothetical protein
MLIINIVCFNKMLTSSDAESIYQVPEKNEKALYAQLNKLKRDNISRDTVMLVNDSDGVMLT